jgi:alkylation response protein AidB-like acyl-CoA dehydrogenase
MNFTFSEEQAMFRESVRRFLADRVPPERVREAWDPDGSAFDQVVWKGLAELGVLGMLSPEEVGGAGLSIIDLIPALEEAGRAALPGPLVEHAAAAVPALVEAGDDGAEWLQSAVSGEIVLTVGFEGAPVDWAREADLILLVVDSSVRAVLPADLTVTRRATVDGSRRSYMVSGSGPGRPIVSVDAAAMFDRGALGAAAQLLGLAEKMLAMTVEYVKQRHQFGVPIGSFQAVKHHLANALIALTYARPVVYRAAVAVAENEATRERDVSFAKAYAGEAAHKVGRIALQCHGAIGYTSEYDLHVWMKRGWALETAWGTSGFHRSRVAAAVLDSQDAGVPAVS